MSDRLRVGDTVRVKSKYPPNDQFVVIQRIVEPDDPDYHGASDHYYLFEKNIYGYIGRSPGEIEFIAHAPVDAFVTYTELRAIDP